MSWDSGNFCVPGIGCAISWDGHFKEQTEHDSFSSVLDLVLNCACFIYIGAWLPFDKFRISEIGVTPWRLVVLVLTILALRRIPSLLLLYKLIPEVRNVREALFCGHFGPMGVSAVFIATLAQSRLKTPHDPPQTQEDHLAIALQPIVAFVVLGSILTHGLSIPFFSASQRTLTITRSIAAQPDWLLRVRRLPPHVDVERRATLEGADDTNTVRKEPHQEEEKQVEWEAGLPDQVEPPPEDVKTSSKVVKANEGHPSVATKRTTITIKERAYIGPNDQDPRS
ncbi:hypothetical protein EDB85DRAFT_2296285 [Lactarius pseudohatsudake]|nr:hypothetical protein EDB85DRAFT_2296285 [Lactarius pseudohatsudake]